MSVTVVVQEAAANEIRDASKWYERKRINWGERFEEEVFRALGRIRGYSDMSTRTCAELPCTNSLMASSTGYPVTPL